MEPGADRASMGEVPLLCEAEARASEASGCAPVLARQDLVWLNAGDAWKITVGRVDDRQLVIDWINDGRPFVVRRDEEFKQTGNDQVALGLPLPTRLKRRRIGFRVPRTIVARAAKMPLLADAIDVAFVHWQRPLNNLVVRLSNCGAVVRVYGSLSWQYMTGEAYLHAASDVDLLIEPHRQSDITGILAVLSQARDSSEPRLDGEIALACGHGLAVAWRELLNQTPDVLVRGLDGVFLMPRARVRAKLLPGESL